MCLTLSIAQDPRASPYPPCCCRVLYKVFPVQDEMFPSGEGRGSHTEQLELIISQYYKRLNSPCIRGGSVILKRSQWAQSSFVPSTLKTEAGESLWIGSQLSIQSEFLSQKTETTTKKIYWVPSLFLCCMCFVCIFGDPVGFIMDAYRNMSDSHAF